MDGLNCQKYNLRFCSNYQNQCNKKGRGKSKYLGVTIAIHGDAYYVDGVRYYTEKREKYVAAIRKNGKRHYIGQFNVEEDAARAYDKMAKEFHGEFARINFPE